MASILLDILHILARLLSISSCVCMWVVGTFSILLLSFPVYFSTSTVVKNVNVTVCMWTVRCLGRSWVSLVSGWTSHILNITSHDYSISYVIIFLIHIVNIPIFCFYFNLLLFSNFKRGSDKRVINIFQALCVKNLKLRISNVFVVKILPIH